MAPDLPRFYRAALTYHPEIGTFRGGRGAWRVRDCESTFAAQGIVVFDFYIIERKTLHMDVPRLLRRNTFVNPTVLLKILLEQRRANAMLATAARVWEGPCPKQQSGS
jgi:hypothetical protein